MGPPQAIQPRTMAQKPNTTMPMKVSIRPPSDRAARYFALRIAVIAISRIDAALIACTISGTFGTIDST